MGAPDNGVLADALGLLAQEVKAHKLDEDNAFFIRLKEILDAHFGQPFVIGIARTYRDCYYIETMSMKPRPQMKITDSGG